MKSSPVGCGLTVALLACNSAERVHPRAEGLPHTDGPAATIPVSDHFDRPVDHGEPRSIEQVIGTIDGEEGPSLGRVIDADLNSRVIAVLDGFANTVRMFDRHGASLSDLGAPGQGPGEFTAVRALDLSSADEAVVFEANGRISFFDSLSSGPALKRMVRFPGEIQDGCTLGGELIVHGFVRGRTGILHRVSNGGDILQSWGSGYSDGNEIVRMQASSGRVACVAEARAVVFAPSMLPEVRAYNLEGRLLWWDALLGFRSQEIVEVPRGSRMRMPCEGFHSSERIVPVPIVSDNAVMLQVALIQPACGTRKEARVSTRSYIIDAVDGHVSFWAAGLPILHATHGRVGLADGQEDFPTVATMSLSFVDELRRTHRTSETEEGK